MTDKIESYFPGIQNIKEQNLRRIVRETFIEALKTGGWNAEDMNTIPATLLIPDCPFSFLQHTIAVTSCALAVGREMKKIYGDALQIDFDVLIAGGLLHDVGKLLEIERDPEGGFRKSAGGKLLRHPISGTAIASGKGAPDEVLHIIACHSKEGEAVRRTTEAIIIHHADFSNFEPFRT